MQSYQKVLTLNIHWANTYKFFTSVLRTKRRKIHVTRDTKGILSNVVFKLDSPLLKNYENLVDQIYAMVLRPFYCSTNYKGLDHITKD